MFGRSKLPRYLADETGMPAAATPIEPTGEGTWIGGWDGYLAVIPAEGGAQHLHVVGLRDRHMGR